MSNINAIKEFNSILQNSNTNTKSSTKLSNELINSELIKFLVNNITNEQIYEFFKNDKVFRICDNRYRQYVNNSSIVDVLEYVGAKRKTKNLFSLLDQDEDTNKLLAYMFNINKNKPKSNKSNSQMSDYNIGDTGDLTGGAKNKRKIHIGKKGGKYYIKTGKKIYIK